MAQALAHARQHKVLVLESERFDWILSTKDEGILVFDEPLEVLALSQLNGVGKGRGQIDIEAAVGGAFNFLKFDWVTHWGGILS